MREINLASFGGIADGVTDNSDFFAAALQALKEAGGGSLKIGKGVWRTGPIEIFSNITIVLDEEAVLLFIPDPERYEPVKTRWEGLECFALHPCIFASGQENITITGKGVIDGNGGSWWDMLREKRGRGQQEPETPQELALAALNPGYETQPSGGGGRKLQFLRPPLVQFHNGQK